MLTKTVTPIMEFNEKTGEHQVVGVTEVHKLFGITFRKKILHVPAKWEMQYSDYFPYRI